MSISRLLTSNLTVARLIRAPTSSVSVTVNVTGPAFVLLVPRVTIMPPAAAGVPNPASTAIGAQPASMTGVPASGVAAIDDVTGEAEAHGVAEPETVNWKLPV